MTKKVWKKKTTYRCETCGIRQEFENGALLMLHLKDKHNIVKGASYKSQLVCALDGTGFHQLVYDFEFENGTKIRQFKSQSLEKEDT